MISSFQQEPPIILICAIPRPDPFLFFGDFKRENEKQIVKAITTNKAKMCCDGSVLDHYGSFAYGLAQAGTDVFLFKQHAPVHGDLSQITLTRCELMGILACIKFLIYLSRNHTFHQKHFILITADNQQAILSPKKMVKRSNIHLVQIWTLF